MFGSMVLEVGIGLTFMFLLVSLLCSAMRELIEAFLKSRATDLEKGIIEILGARNNPKALEQFYKHPLINCLYRDGYEPNPKFAQGADQNPADQKPADQTAASTGAFDAVGRWIAGLWPAFKRRQNLPTYIPPANFAVAALSVLMPGGTAPTDAAGVLSIASLRATATKIENDQLRTMLLTALDGAQNDINVVRKNLESWYNSSMDRVSGIYKRRTQIITFFLGLFAAGLFNIDAIRVANHLATDQTYREAIVKDAATFLKAPDSYGQAADSETLKERLDTVRTQVEQSGFAIGWTCTPIDLCKAEDKKAEDKAAADKKAADPKAGDPKAGDPKTGDPKAGDPKAGDPKTGDPKAGDPKTGDPKAADPNAPSVEAEKPSPKVNRPFNGFSTIGGWLVTALAVSLGAPFWFDVLNKFMVVRSTVKPAEKSGQEASKDSSGERTLKAGDSLPVTLLLQRPPRGGADTKAP